MQFPQADLRTKEDGEECEEFLAAEAQVDDYRLGMGYNIKIIDSQ